MITARNYAAQAEKALRESKNVEPAIVESMLHIIKNSQHFAIPDGGKFINDKIRGLINVQLNLPFDKITVEYYYKSEDVPKNVIFASQDANYIYLSTASYYAKHKDWQFSKCVLMVKRNKPCNDEGIRYEVMYPEHVDENYTDERLYNEEMCNKSISFSIFELIEALTCKNVYIESLELVDKKKNKKRVKKGKLPLYETKILVVDSKEKVVDKTDLGGTHASPRQHLRRGHIRRYPTYSIWINNMIVGKSSKGKIDKSYSVL